MIWLDTRSQMAFNTHRTILNNAGTAFRTSSIRTLTENLDVTSPYMQQQIAQAGGWKHAALTQDIHFSKLCFENSSLKCKVRGLVSEVGFRSTERREKCA